MRKSRMNGDNRNMKRIALSALISSALVLAACGGSGEKNKAGQAPTQKQNSNGGAVSAEPTKGILGPAVTVDQVGGAKTVGKGGPISPKEDRPTDAQHNGVAGSAACASTSANPDATNLAAMNAAILCLLNAERSAK